MTPAILLEDGLSSTARARRRIGRRAAAGDRIVAVGPGLRDQLPAGLSLATSTFATAPAWPSRRASSTCTPTTTPSCSTRRHVPQAVARHHDGGDRQLRPVGRALVVDEPQGALTLLGKSFKYASLDAYARAWRRRSPP
jgi:hypothetical protein